MPYEVTLIPGDGTGPELTEVGGRLPKEAIARTLQNPTAPMPSYAQLQRDKPEQFTALVEFLAELR